MKGPSPLLGYNTNVRHGGRLYHIQTEDSGLKHPHIITHLFADGGRIVSSRKTTYADYVGLEDCQVIVKKLMQEQHKAMFIALRDGEYDDDAVAETGEAPIVPAPDEPVPVLPTGDFDALDEAAARLSADVTQPPRSRPGGPGLYRHSEPARALSDLAPVESIFGGDVVSEKSLDEVILSYLAEDLAEPQE